MKIENLIPVGFELIGFFVEEVNKQKLVLVITTTESLRQAEEKARKEALREELHPVEIENIKISSILQLVRSEFIMPNVYSKAHEDLVFSAYKTSFICQFLSNQLELLKESRIKLTSKNNIENGPNKIQSNRRNKERKTGTEKKESNNSGTEKGTVIQLDSKKEK